MFKSDSGFTRIAVVIALIAIIAFAIWWVRNPIQPETNPAGTSEEATGLDMEVQSIDVEFDNGGLEDIDKDINSL